MQYLDSFGMKIAFGRAPTCERESIGSMVGCMTARRCDSERPHVLPSDKGEDQHMRSRSVTLVKCYSTLFMEISDI